MVELKSLHLSNFFSHKDSTLNLSDLEGLVLLEGRNLSGLYGSNGSGKSSVLEGIVYSITGNTLRNVGVSDIVNREVGKDTCADLHIINNGVEMNIARYRKDTKNGDSIVLTEDGKDISSRLNKSTQVTIDTKLNIPYKVLVNTILLGEGLSSRFTQLSDPDKKSLIESTLSLSYDVNQLREKANSEVKRFRIELAEINGSINATKDAITKMETLMENPTSEADVQECIIKRDELSEKVASLKSDLEVVADKITVLDKAKREYEIMYHEYTTTYNKYNDMAGKLNTLQTNPTPHCSLCNQPLTSKEAFDRVVDQYTSDLKNIKELMDAQYTKLSESPPYETINSKLTEFHKNYSAIKAEYDSTNIAYTNLVANAASLQAKLDHSQLNKEQYNEYRARLEDLNVSLGERSTSLSDYEYIYKLFSPTGLVNYILEEALHYINDRMKAYTEMLFDKYYVFEMVKGKLSLVDPSGSSYQSLSNGEKRRLDICIQLSLHDYVYNYCGVKIDTMFIDEVLDGLDAVGVSNIFDVLRAKMNYCGLKRILVITHNDTLKDKFDSVVTVEKGSDGFSTIINTGGN